MYVRKRPSAVGRAPTRPSVPIPTPPRDEPNLSGSNFSSSTPPIPTEQSAPSVLPTQAPASVSAPTSEVARTALPFRTPYGPFGRASIQEQAIPTAVQEDVGAVEEQQAQQSEASFTESTPETGFLKVETFIADRAAPVGGVNIVISKVIDGMEHIFFNAQTNESGIINDIRLPAPRAQTSLAPDQPFPYATYLLSAAKRGFLLVPSMEIQIFEGVKTIGRIPMRLDLTGGVEDAAL